MHNYIITYSYIFTIFAQHKSYTMNLFHHISYIIRTAPEGEFPAMASKLLLQLPKDKTIIRLVFFGAPRSNEEYKKQHITLSSLVKETFGSKTPAISYIAQPPLNAGLIMEAHIYNAGNNDNIIHKETNNIHYILLENEYGRCLFAGGIQGDIDAPIEKQSKDVFQILDTILKKERFDIHNIVRQWNYIERIIDFEGENQNYQSFNNARSDFYNKTSWTNGYPAATGIGMNYGGIIIDLDIVESRIESLSIIPIDNKLQIAAHKYSEQVLEKAQTQKATPKFERAKALTYKKNKLVYISGTAAIRGEESLKDVGLKEQLRITMENIAQLTGDAELTMLRVYFKDAVDEKEIKELMAIYDLNIPILYVQANVCRTELLIEIEGIAIE